MTSDRIAVRGGGDVRFCLQRRQNLLGSILREFLVRLVAEGRFLDHAAVGVCQDLNFELGVITYLVMRSMAVLTPAVIISDLYVPVYASASSSLQAPITLTAATSADNRTNIDKMLLSRRALLPKSEFWAIDSQISKA
jgi:hypothetical protein